MGSVTLSLPEAYDLALAVLSANGFSADHAAAIARNVAAGERDGCASHGLWRLLGIVDTLRKGKVSPDAEPQIHDQAPAIVRADAGAPFRCWPTNARYRCCWRKRGTAVLRRWRLTAASIFPRCLPILSR